MRVTIGRQPIQVNVGIGTAFALSAAARAETAADAAELASDSAHADSLDTGAYKDAVLLAVAGIDPDATLPLQAVSRTILAGFSGMAAGRQAFLGEAGREGVFKWTTGDQSAFVSADTDQAIWVAPTAASTGASGAWKRVVPLGLAEASWAGVVPATTTDYRAALNRLLALTDVIDVRLPLGTVQVSGSVKVPSGKGLCGRGQGASILKAKSTFAIDGSMTSGNSLVHFDSATVGCRLHDLTLDGGKVGDHLVNGVNGLGKRFTVERVHFKDCSGYSCWPVNGGATSIDSHVAVVRDCLSENANVHFETTNGGNILFDNVHARDGDGDISCETMFHCLLGSKHITFRNSTGIRGNGAVVSLVSNSPTDPLDDILFESCLFQSNGGAFTVNVQAGGSGSAINNVRFNNCQTINPTGGGWTLAGDAAHRADVRVQGGKITARQAGIEFTQTDLKISRTEFLLNAASGAVEVNAFVMGAGSTLVVDGPRIDTDRAFDYPIGTPASPDVTVIGSPVLLVPKDQERPWGPGHKIRRVLEADFTPGGGGVVIGSGLPQQFSVASEVAGTYRVHLKGFYRAATTNGLNFYIDGFGSYDIAGRGRLSSKADGTGDIDKPISTAANLNLASTTTSHTGVSLPFEVDVLASFDGSAAAFSFYAAPFNGSGYTGTLTIQAGTILEIEWTA